MTADKLNSRQLLSLNKTIQAALDRAAVSIKMMLGGEIYLGLVPTPARPSGVCVHLGLIGAVEGGVYIDLPEKMAAQIVKTLIPGQDLCLLDETARSVLMELGNILASVFVAYFDQFLGLRTLPTPPALSFVPLDIPAFSELFVAEFSWSKCQERAEVVIGLERSALDILLAG